MILINVSGRRYGTGRSESSQVLVIKPPTQPIELAIGDGAPLVDPNLE